MVKEYVRLCVPVPKHNRVLYQGVKEITFLQMTITSITVLDRNQEELKEEFYQDYTN